LGLGVQSKKRRARVNETSPAFAGASRPIGANDFAPAFGVHAIYRRFCTTSPGASFNLSAHDATPKAALKRMHSKRWRVRERLRFGDGAKR
jgi:hypothetical protein